MRGSASGWIPRERVPWLQLPAAAWGAFVELSGRACPLTAFENRFRALAGLDGYAECFVERYLVALIYPDGLTRELQWLLAVVVIAVNAAIYGFVLFRRRATRKPQP